VENAADFADTAALIAELDVITTMDTWVAQMAAAMANWSGSCCTSRPTGDGWRWFGTV